MDNERIRAICMGLPHVAETVNWGHHLVYWVGDRDISGKMFAMTDLDGTGYGKLLFHAGDERFHEYVEREGMVASPYLAKAKWVTMLEWDTLRPREVEEALAQAHGLIFEKLPARTKKILAMPEAERKMLIKQRKAKLAAKSVAKSRTASVKKSSTSKRQPASKKK